jgi:predicted secreted protein
MCFVDCGFKKSIHSHSPQSFNLKGNIMKKKVLVAAVLAACANSGYAADAPTAPTLGQVLDASGLSVTGYMDMAYNKMNTTGLFTNSPAGPITGGSAGNSRIFDTPGATQGQNFNSFNFNQAAIIISKLPKEGLGGLINITAGQDAAVVASSGLGANNNNVTNADITQAFMNYATGALTVQAGKFATLAGAELITSPSNMNYSRAWMFGWGPYTHTGVRTTYVANDMVTLIGGVNNGWDQVNSQSYGKTAELSLALTASPMFSLATTLLDGAATSAMGNMSGVANTISPVPVTQGNRTYLDMVGTITATSQLKFVFDYAHGKQKNAMVVGKDAQWHALALYANYQLDDTWRLAYRSEVYDDPTGFRSGVAQNLASNTVTVGYAVSKTLEVRGEVRADKSTQNSFLQSNGKGTNGQRSYSVDAIYQF